MEVAPRAECQLDAPYECNKDRAGVADLPDCKFDGLCQDPRRMACQDRDVRRVFAHHRRDDRLLGCSLDHRRVVGVSANQLES